MKKSDYAISPSRKYCEYVRILLSKSLWSHSTICATSRLSMTFLPWKSSTFSSFIFTPSSYCSQLSKYPALLSSWVDRHRFIRNLVRRMRHFSIPWILSLVVQLLALAQIHTLTLRLLFIMSFCFGLSTPI